MQRTGNTMKHILAFMVAITFTGCASKVQVEGRVVRVATDCVMKYSCDGNPENICREAMSTSGSQWKVSEDLQNNFPELESKVSKLFHTQPVNVWFAGENNQIAACAIPYSGCGCNETYVEVFEKSKSAWVHKKTYFVICGGGHPEHPASTEMFKLEPTSTEPYNLY